MKLAVRSLPLLALLLASLPGLAAGQKDKKDSSPRKVVDSGSFGIFVKGQRVATEKFEIEQKGDSSITRAELNVDSGTSKATQKSELELSATGDLLHYSWNELSPEKAEATVDPDQNFLMERIKAGPEDKMVEQQFILPLSTAILDDYFFSHRELLAWRYLGSNCTPTPGGETACKLSKAQFAVLIPRQRTSMLVTMTFVGKERVMLRGHPVELDRFDLQGEGLDWALWLDEAHKLQRVVIAANFTEVVRD